MRLLHYADVENVYDDPERIGRLAGLIDHLRDENTVVCGSGDNTGPGVLSLVTRGRQALDFFHAVEPDVETFGNHDFDHGPDALLDVINDSPQTWVCANAFRDGERFAATAGAEPWTIVEAGNCRVGIVGIAHPETTSINPYAADVQFTDPLPAVEEGVEAVRDRDVDRIAVVSHLGDDTDLARTVDVDVVLGGHDHETLVKRVDDTLVCRPGGNGRYILEVTFDSDQPTATHHAVNDGPLDTDVATALHDRTNAAGLTEVVGTAEESVICDMMASKRGESKLGNLITDAYRWKTEADVGLYASGGFRRRPPLTGEVTAFDLVGIIPFNRDLVVLRVDGDALTTIFRQTALVQSDDTPQWFFGHVSGAELVWNDATDELRAARVNGDSVNPGEIYEIATSEFYVENNQMFPAFGPDDVVERYGLEYDAVIEYVREVGLDPELEGRIRRPTLAEETIPQRDWPFSP